MRGLLRKSLCEVWFPTLLASAGLMLILALLTTVLPQLEAGIGEVLNRIPFIKKILASLLGPELADEISLPALRAILWVHPTLLSILWAFEIVICTRLPAGEIDRGTIDFLLSLPVSRRTHYLVETGVWLAAGLVVLGCGYTGHRMAAAALSSEMALSGREALTVLSNLYALYIAVGGIAWLVSSLSSHRGRAIGTVFGIILVSFLVNFVAQFWQPLQAISFLSLLEYYRPAQILTKGEFPVGNIAVLLGIGLASWAAGGEILARRSITTV